MEKRRTKVVGTFPDGESALMLVGACLRHVTSSEWEIECYLNMEHLKLLLLADREALAVNEATRLLGSELKDHSPSPVRAGREAGRVKQKVFFTVLSHCFLGLNTLEYYYGSIIQLNRMFGCKSGSMGWRFFAEVF